MYYSEICELPSIDRTIKFPLTMIVLKSIVSLIIIKSFSRGLLFATNIINFVATNSVLYYSRLSRNIFERVPMGPQLKTSVNF